MAANRRYRVFGRWYGQAFADASMETWASLEDAKRQLLWRDNGNLCLSISAQETEEYSGVYRIGSRSSSMFYAGDNEFRFIDLYHSTLQWDQNLDSWVWLVGDSYAWKRLTIGPRGGVVVENG